MHVFRRHRHWLARALFGVLLLGWLSAFAGVCQAMAASGGDAGPAAHAARHPAADHDCCADAGDPCLHGGCELKSALPTTEPQWLAAARLLTVAPPPLEGPVPVLPAVPAGAGPDPGRSPSPDHPLHLQYCVFLD